MKDLEQEQQMQETMIKALCCLDAHILMNLYATENVVFGHIKANEQIPFDKYIDDLGIQSFSRYLDIKHLDGHAIENGYIKERPFNEICFELYRDKIDYIFDKAPKYNDSDKEYDDDLYHYKHGLYEYLKNLYTLFREIITIEVSPEFFVSVPDIIDKKEQRIYYAKITKFVTAIKLRRLRQGGCVDRYVKDMPFISPLIRRLLKRHKGHYILANNDTDSLDYKFALFSCFHFFNEYNAKLLELKILRWEELNR